MQSSTLQLTEHAEEASSSAVLGVEASLIGRRWAWRAGAEDPALMRLGAALAQQLGIPEIVGRLLAMRQITPDQAPHFLEPKLRALMPDPSSLTDMDKAAERMAKAVQNREVIGIFGDYDVDGACASAILASFFEQLGCTVHTHIPDRMTEGYGPNVAALDNLVAQGASILICVDCGTASADILSQVTDKADVIVLDHHKSEDALPPILATVNPNRPDCSSGLHHICAAALAFLAAVATTRDLRRADWFTADQPPPDLMRQLDLVALATVCDVMPLHGLNRAFVTQGLKIMARRQRTGLNALMEIAGVTKAPDAFSCGFALGPRINAGGRIAEAALGLRLLRCPDSFEARQMAERLDAVNRRRQGVEADILDRAMQQAEAQKEAGHAVILLAGKDWHPGVVGIVAGRIKERFNRPALVGAEQEDGTIKGSGRSVPGLDLGTVIIAARQAGMLKTGGGHAMAAGFSLTADKLEDFHTFLDTRLAQAATLPEKVPLTVDAVVSISGATAELAQDMGALAPFGAGNPEPLLAIPRVTVIRADRIGRDGNTLRLLLKGENNGRLKALLFRAHENPLAAKLEDTTRPALHLAGYLRAESWNGRTDATFFIQDAAAA
ncbi:single-stranded-DNA-specific exonuclease RecJ [Acetobacter pasteurianus subsp. pasteurianus LMG 1262 = NBRC 106471]|uniref:single-stranded-DNA-specific exonuclease RecJ n=1 Tax=Acetobacter pasteurianus TaxID=438 RepID=UPI0002457D22|nr:single-stranded-DNA-specific exonuclease RecJ [Acetobacter pasteurianus]GAB30545.1 single-stranded-DNA-specific exonuclease RecJ [Acetobacter pasteurianus subsp. pasteurianus LMG 1262 = NBRC 106471]GCD50445.1 single-stranded-DNA-specific exonuclease RecJ [Acetobacter pasteurianus subsp. pasteurianus LMG 1262 = NBRC 106471]